MRRKRTALPVSPLPLAALHYLATGAFLDDAEGVARYGPDFEALAAWTTPEAHTRNFAATWQTHRAAIEAFATRLGLDEPWLAHHVD